MLAALREYDEVGRDGFLRKYSFKPSRKYLLEHQGHCYDSKAVAGAAYGYLSGAASPLRWDEFSGGRGTVVPLMRRLGFAISER
ncbi:MAG: hypothetical protein ACOY45_00555 [Pseudomonadota bacterium]